MRVRLAVSLAVLLLLLVVGVEAAARPIASRIADRAVGSIATAASVEVVAISRPAVVGLVRGRLHDVRLRIEGLRIGPLTVATTDAVVPRLSVRPEPGDTLIVGAEARVTEAAIELALRDLAPDLAAPTVRIDPGGIVVSDDRLPLEVPLEIVVGDGVVRLAPGIGDARLWAALGLELRIGLPACMVLDTLELHEGEIHGRLEATLTVRADGRLVC